MSEWITDRLPTINDRYGTCVCVWVACGDGEVWPRTWHQVEKDQPWQPMPKPAPYVKPKRWTVSWSQHGNVGTWTLYSHNQSAHTLCGDLPTDAAERICDIYNEELP
jgi:hypothetical protein